MAIPIVDCSLEGSKDLIDAGGCPQGILVADGVHVRDIVLVRHRSRGVRHPTERVVVRFATLPGVDRGITCSAELARPGHNWGCAVGIEGTRQTKVGALVAGVCHSGSDPERVGRENVGPGRYGRVRSNILRHAWWFFCAVENAAIEEAIVTRRGTTNRDPARWRGTDTGAVGAVGPVELDARTTARDAGGAPGGDAALHSCADVAVAAGVAPALARPAGPHGGTKSDVAVHLNELRKPPPDAPHPQRQQEPGDRDDEATVGDPTFSKSH